MYTKIHGRDMNNCHSEYIIFGLFLPNEQTLAKPQNKKGYKVYL